MVKGFINYCDGQIPFVIEEYKMELFTDNGILKNFSAEHNKKANYVLFGECFTILRLLQRFAVFMVSHVDVSFKRITLYKNELATGWFYSKSVFEEATSGYDVLFCEFEVEKYVPYTPQRFVEQVIAFEYLFEKLEPKKARDRAFPLKEELKSMLDIFADVMPNGTISSEDISEKLEEVRRNITHGYSYYYDFKDDSRLQYMIIQLDKLIKAMSMKHMGFSQKEIYDFIRY